MKRNISAISLVLANLVPLAGAIFLDWNAGQVVFLYWLESLIIGVLNIFKINKASARDQAKKNQSKKFLVSFFMFHYGIFMFVHLIFVLIIFKIDIVSFWSLLLSFACLVASHLVSYQANFIGKREYQKVSPSKQLFAPYKRVIVMHFTIFGAGWALISFGGDGIAGLAVLVIIKIVVDLASHRFEHRSVTTKFKSPD